MGYRSDVRMVIVGDKDVILREFANLRLTGDDTVRDVMDEWEVKPGRDDEAVAILGRGGTDWKWYEGYSDVKAHNRIFGHFAALQDNAEDGTPERNLNGAFVRIGENDDDTETRYFGDIYPADIARPVRSIDCQYDYLEGEDLRPRLVQTAA